MLILVAALFSLGLVSETAAESVEIHWDSYGVPHILADSDPSAYFGWGYAQAREHLEDLQLYYTLADARMAAVFGPGENGDHIESDFQVHLHRLALQAGRTLAHLSPETVSHMEAFTDGINHFMATHPETRESWYREVTVMDPLRWTELTLFDFYRDDLLDDLDRARRYFDMEAVQPGSFFALHPHHPAAPATLMNGPTASAPCASRKRNHNPALFGRIPDSIERGLRVFDGRIPQSIASNVWGTAPALSTTGTPILAHDPHLMLQGPSRQWELSIESPGLHIAGHCYIGLPVINHGHNRHIAYGATNNVPDIGDLYVERLDETGTQYLTDRGEYAPIETDSFAIEVLGQEPVIREGRYTAHGPILGTLSSFAYVARSAANAQPPQSRTADQYARIMRAENVNEFADALSMLQFSKWNQMAVDRAGDLYYLDNARVPRRSEVYDWSLPVPGFKRASRWQGLHSFDELVSVQNPESGFLMNCNNLSIQDLTGFPEYHPRRRFGIALGRGARVVEVLSTGGPFDLEDHMALQTDSVHHRARMLKGVLLDHARSTQPTDPLVLEAISTLEAWDDRATVDARGQLLFRVWFSQLVDSVFNDEFGHFGPMSREYLVTELYLPQMRWADSDSVLATLRPYVDDVTTPEAENLTDLAVRALERATALLMDALGSISMRWGDVHVLIRGDRVEAAPGGTGGETLDASGGPIDFTALRETVNEGVASRVIVELGEKVRMHTVLPFGQSDRPESPNFDDQMSLYLNGEYRIPPFYRDDVIAQAVEVTLLDYRP